ncbi:hypothetical protein C8J57DRAFT_1708613 [Mycena rebaudengoi]|nr:hypothetical protein C8J57DRAFT_1708613 [Mycena rebaudengoi]
MLSESTTTETTTYMLEKYSRAYSSKKETGNSEWQHFTNPVLRIILDTKRSPEKAESFRLRIVWTMNGGSSSSSADQQEVVLEDLDLLAFSSLKDRKTDSLPLKGVYRDMTFGLRYLHIPDSTESHKVYRRFQVAFTTCAAANQLVDAIRDVCPCKPTEPTTQDRRRPGGVPQSLPMPHPLSSNAWDQPSLYRSDSVARVSAHLQRAPALKITNTALAFSSSPALPSSSQPERPAIAFTSSPLAVPAPSVHRPLYDPFSNATPQGPMFPTNNDLSKPPSFPESSPPSSSADSAMMPPPPPPPSMSPGNADTILASLREATGLYDLSHAALERLVGDVVREDKFVNLLENLSKMWAVKALSV